MPREYTVVDLGKTSRIFCFHPECKNSTNGSFVVKRFAENVTGRVGLYCPEGWQLMSLRDDVGGLMLVYVCPECKAYHRIYGGVLWEAIKKENQEQLKKGV